MSGLTEQERDALISALCAPDPDRAPLTEIQVLFVAATVDQIANARVKAALEAVERDIAARLDMTATARWVLGDVVRAHIPQTSRPPEVGLSPPAS